MDNNNNNDNKCEESKHLYDKCLNDNNDDKTQCIELYEKLNECTEIINIIATDEVKEEVKEPSILSRFFSSSVTEEVKEEEVTEEVKEEEVVTEEDN